ncbi:MAG: HDIG domain-containing protein [Bacteroidales bacterium]|nr:HDIG domain-containing protein [Bacteroidales bacterium]
MLPIFDKIRNNYKYIGTLLLFLATFLIMAYLMPRERKFDYVYSKGSPWKEADLTAPFKFSIYKTNEVYQAEVDSALKNLKLYFNFDAYQLAEQLAKFKESFNEDWEKFASESMKITTDDYSNSDRYENIRKLQEEYEGFLFSTLEKIYLKGIVQVPEGEDINLEPSTDIVLVRGNIAEEIYYSDMFTPKSAYEFIQQKIQEDITGKRNRYLSRYKPFITEFEIERFILPNVYYNKDVTEKERDLIVKDISKAQGGIMQGELIISNGEIVTAEKYQILESLRSAYLSQKRSVNTIFVLVGKMIFVMFSLVLIYIFLYNFRREVLKDLVKTSFILFMLVLMVFVASTSVRLEKISFYVIPFTILPIILRTFFDERLALFVHVLATILVGFISPNVNEFIILNILAGIVAIFSLTNLYRRSRFFVSALLVVITYSLAYIAIFAIREGTFPKNELMQFANFGLNGVLILISFLLIYIFEKTFGFLSDTTLMELSDTNQPMLRKIAEIAPGTFQHSLQVANLSEEALYHIGGNPLLVRTGALYHDIGKMYDPIYFIENQTSGINPHDNLEFSESAKAIINHVSKGVELAKKNNLPQPIIDFIMTHHGTTTVQYFYKSYIKKYPEQEGDTKEFSYPGPKPFSKEMAVLMMADAVEAASRSLSEYSYENISDLVEKIINRQLKEGQFEDAPITFKDIATVKEVFKTRLKNIYHARISYPA